MTALERPRVKSFIERKNEEAELLQKKEQQIKQHLITIKNNPKFLKVLNIELISLQNLISQENSDYFINIHLIMKLDGIKILCNISSVNSKNEDIINKTTIILNNLIKNDNKKTYELSKYFIEKNGQNDIFQLLISLKNEKGIENLLEIIYYLIPIPQFFNVLLESEMIDTIKFLFEFNISNLSINNLLNKITAKITNHKKVRDLIINNDFVQKIVSNIDINIKNKNIEIILDGLIILDNILKNENGKKIIKELNIFNILGEGLSFYFIDERIPSMINKIYIKIITKEDIEEKLNKMKQFLSNGINIPGNIDELIDLFNYLSNFILVDDIGKIMCNIDNIKLLFNFFCSLYSLELKNKDMKFVINYISLMKFFLVIFKRMIGYDAELINIESDKGKILYNNKMKIFDIIKKIFDNIIQIENENQKNEIMIIFKQFFPEYCDIFLKLYKKTKNDKNESKHEILLLEYIMDKIIINSDESFDFYKDEKINYYFSFLLNIILNSNKSHNLLIQCFPYFSQVIINSQNKFTLSNILETIYNLLKISKNTHILKEDIIPTIIKFMNEKSNFRYPNLINLKILKMYLNTKENEEDNNDINDDIDFINSICSVMVKGHHGIYSQNIEKKILLEGSDLLKVLVSNELFEEKNEELKIIIKEYNCEENNPENMKQITDNIYFFISILNINEFLIKGAENILDNIKDLFNKETNYIENYKKEKSKEKEMNSLYTERCNQSTTIINLCLNALRKIEDGIIIIYNKDKDDLLIDLIKVIINFNIEIIEKSSDVLNLVNHLNQLRKNIIFLISNESTIKFKDNQTIIDKHLNSLIILLRKNIYNDKILLAIIKTFNLFSEYKNDIYNYLLSKKGCISIILQFLISTNNSQLCLESIHLLKNICLSNKDNLINLANLNILKTLFEIHNKFINDENINNNINLIINEIKKLPNEGIHIEEILLNAIKNFNQNINNDFNNDNIKFKLLNDLIIITSYTNNKIQIKKLLNIKIFINNFISLLNKTLQEKKLSQIIDKLFTSEIELMKKLITQIPINNDKDKEENDKLNQNFCDILLVVLFHEFIYAENFLLACNTLLVYLKNDYLYNNFLSHKIDKKFIEQILEQEENYNDNLQISKVINKIISLLALKNSDFANHIIKKGGFINIIEDLKTLVTLNDPKNKMIKYNSLILIHSLLNDENNMEVFIKHNGFELINNILKNETNSSQNQNIVLNEQYKSLCCINCSNSNEINNITDRKSKKSYKMRNSMMASDINIEENYLRNSSKLNIKQVPEIEDSFDKDNNHILYCMKIIIKCLNKDKRYLHKNMIDNLIKISDDYFPDKNLFLQLIEVVFFYLELDISKQNGKDDFIRNKNLLKLFVSNIAYFYCSEKIIQKANDITNKIGELLFNKNEYIAEIKNVLNEKYEGNNYSLKFYVLTYVSIISDLPIFKNLKDKIKNELIIFFNDSLFTFKTIYQKNEENNSNFSKNYIINKEGIILSLIKLYNYLINTNIINKNNKEIPENINYIEQLCIDLYIPSNYNFVNEYEKEISKLLGKNIYAKNNLFHLKYIFTKIIEFIKDFSEEIKYSDYNDEQNIIEKKEINLDNVLLSAKNYYKINEDKNIKEDSCLEIFEELIKLLEILFDDERIKENNIKFKDISIMIKLIWKIIFNCLQIDLNNKKLILGNIFNYDIFQKLTKTINIKTNNRPSLRKNSLILSEKNESNMDLNELLFEFVNSDIKTYGKTNEKIKQYDIKTLSNISHNLSIIKLIFQDKILLQLLKDEYSKSNLSNELRLYLSIIFKNATKNNIKLDSNLIQLIFSKILKNPIKSLDNGGKLIIETEIESVINIMKNKSLFGNLIKKNIINNDDIKKIESLYDNLDKNICKEFKKILAENEIDKKIKQTLKSINDDEEAMKEIEKFVLVNYEKHTLEYIKLFERMKKEDLILNNTTKKELINEDGKRILNSKEIKQENKIKEKIKTPLSMINNQKIYLCISEILLILVKNFNLIIAYKDDIYNNRRVKLINKSFNLLQILSLTKDNHLSILEEGLINLLEKILDEYKSIQKIKNAQNSNEEYNKFLFNLIVKAKFILKEYSQYENASELILESSLFSHIISEIMNFQNDLNNSNNNGNLRKIFIYDNSIIASIFSVTKFHEQIIEKLNINSIIELGIKSGNIVLLENIVDLIAFYLNKNNIESLNEILDKIISLIDKCIKNKNCSVSLMTKIFQLISVLYSNDNTVKNEKIENLKIIESININFKKFSHDYDYIYSSLNCLVIIIKNNEKLTEECFKSDLIKNIKIAINNYVKEIPPNYTLIIWKVTEFYYLLLKSKKEMIKTLCELNITSNMVNYLDIYNNKVMPKTEVENALNMILKKNETKIIKINYVQEILMNCINYLNIITTSIEGNNYLSEDTSFNKCILLVLENENNDNNFLSLALQCLCNYFKSESGQIFLATNIEDIFDLLTNLQNKYNNDIGILIININHICETVINCNKIEKNYKKNFFDILTESIKFKKIDLNLIVVTLTIITKSLEKNRNLIDSITTQFISSIINILKKHKENYEISYYCYTIISFIIDENYIPIFSGIIKDLFQQIKKTVIEFNKQEAKDKKNKDIIEKIKDSINDLIIFLSNIKSFSDFIISEILIPFIQEINDLSIEEEAKLPFIIGILDNLLQNEEKIYIKPFVDNNGLEKILSLLKTVKPKCKNIKVILKIFIILKSILKSGDKYKIIMQNLKFHSIMSNIIKLNLDKKLEFEGKSILFLMNQTTPQLEKVEVVDYTSINIVDPIGPVVKNFLTNGKYVKIINQKGEIKEMQLSFSQDLAKVQAKSIKNNLPPKSKNVIEINNIKSIIKGHGTNIFKKCGGIFKSIPNAENCFSIVGPLVESGQPKSINVVCNSENDVDKWIKYMEIVINYFMKKKLIGFVNIIKVTQNLK